MTFGAWEIVGTNDRELPFGKTLSDALVGLIRKRWPHNTAKMLERRWTLDPKTARNVLGQGNVSERTLTKAAKAEGWALWHALGEELFGESYYEYDQRRIEAILREAQGELSNVRRIRERTEAILAGAGRGDADRNRPLADQIRGGQSRTWREADPSSYGAADRSGPDQTRLAHHRDDKPRQTGG